MICTWPVVTCVTVQIREAPAQVRHYLMTWGFINNAFMLNAQASRLSRFAKSRHCLKNLDIHGKYIRVEASESVVGPSCTFKKMSQTAKGLPHQFEIV